MPKTKPSKTGNSLQREGYAHIKKEGKAQNIQKPNL